MTFSVYKRLLSDDQEHNLRYYKYKAEDRSLTYRFLLRPLYERLVEYVPPWVAPNTITLCGFLAPIFSHFLVMLFPTLTDTMPFMSKCYALSVLWYMVLDNLDGKQARRTKSSSPLGQLFDHGCDALNVTVCGILMLPFISYPHPIYAFVFVSCCGVIPFYMTTLEEFCTGYLILPIVNGPSEGLLFISSILFFRLHFNFFTIIVVAVVFCTYCVVGSLLRMRAHIRNHAQSARFTKATLFIFFIVAIQYLTALLAPTQTNRYFFTLLWQAGLLLFESVCRMMVATHTHSALPAIEDHQLLMPFLLSYSAVILLAQATPMASSSTNINSLKGMTSLVVYSCVIYSVVYTFWRTYCLIRQITQFLNIYCFSLRRRQRQSK